MSGTRTGISERWEMRNIHLISAGISGLLVLSLSAVSAQPTMDVTGIIEGNNPFAIVNGQVVSVGGTVDGLKVTGIGENTVSFAYDDDIVTVKVGDTLTKADYPRRRVRAAEKTGTSREAAAPPAVKQAGKETPPPAPAVTAKTPPAGTPSEKNEPEDIKFGTPAVEPAEKMKGVKEAAEEMGWGTLVKEPSATKEVSPEPEAVSETSTAPSPGFGKVEDGFSGAESGPGETPSVPAVESTPAPPVGTRVEKGVEARRSEVEEQGGKGDAVAVGFLIEALRNDRDGRVRADAAKALGKIGDPRVLPPLLEALKDEDDTVRLFVSMGLFWMAQDTPGRLRGQGTLDALFEALSDENEMVRWNAVDILGELKDPRSVGPLFEALKREKDTDLVSIFEETLVSMKGIDDPRIRDYLAKRDDVNWKNYSLGQTRLHEAAYFGKNDEILNILSRGGDINAKDNTGKTPLVLAITNAPTDTVELLLSMGADVNIKDGQGDSSLHFAAMGKDEKLVDILAARNADINVENNEGETALDLAMEFGRQEMALCLIKNGAKEKKSLAKHGNAPDTGDALASERPR